MAITYYYGAFRLDDALSPPSLLVWHNGAWVAAIGPSVPAPAVRAYHNAAQSLTNNAFTTLAFNSTRFDQGTATAQHDNSTNNSRLTCRHTGIYQITGQVEFASNSTGQRAIALHLNGSTYIDQVEQGAVSGDVTIMNITTLYSLTSGDYVELQAFQNRGGSLNADSAGNQYPEFMMVQVG